MNLVKLHNGIVVAVIELSDSANLPTHADLGGFLITPWPVVAGQVYEPEARTFAPAPRRPWLTKLAFDSRFTMEESVKLKMAQVLPARETGESDAAYAARCAVPLHLQVMSERRSMATYIDLGHADTRGGVLQLEAIGLLGAGRANEILNAPIESHEYAAGA